MANRIVRRTSVRTTVTPSSNGKSVRVRTTVNNGHSTRTTAKTVRVK